RSRPARTLVRRAGGVWWPYMKPAYVVDEVFEKVSVRRVAGAAGRLPGGLPAQPEIQGFTAPADVDARNHRLAQRGNHLSVRGLVGHRLAVHLDDQVALS